MMKQPCTLLDKRDPQFLRCVKNGPVVLRPRRRGDVFDSTPRGAVDIVDEGELEYLAISNLSSRGTGGEGEPPGDGKNS